MALIEKNLNTLPFFRNWDWDVGVGIDFNSGDMNIEERSEKIGLVYKKHRSDVRNMASQEINRFSHADQGVFAEIPTCYLLRDYISTGNIFLDVEDSRITDAHRIYGGSVKENIELLCNRYLECTVSADIEWSCFLVELMPLGYEEGLGAFPEQIPARENAWIKASLNDMYIKKNDFLNLVGKIDTVNREKKNRLLS